MTGMRHKWLGIMATALMTGALASSLVAADDDRHKNPFTQILHKLDRILSKLDGDSGSGNHTLRWDSNYPSSSRFVTLAAFHHQAVLDKNTGLVWEQAPDATFSGNWTDAKQHCLNRTVGGTVGWRLPSVVELKSVQDPSLGAPFVPTTVFTGILQPDVYDVNWWSSSSVLAGNPAGNPWIVSFVGNGGQGYGSPDRNHSAWCVRGPTQEHQY